eukprot:5448677-Amphidinium_carterae.1
MKSSSLSLRATASIAHVSSSAGQRLDAYSLVEALPLLVTLGPTGGQINPLSSTDREALARAVDAVASPADASEEAK